MKDNKYKMAIEVLAANIKDMQDLYPNVADFTPPDNDYATGYYAGRMDVLNKLSTNLINLTGGGK